MMTRQEQRKLNKDTVPTWFNFKVNKRLLEQDDPNFIYYAERIKPKLFCITWQDEKGKLNNRLYSLNDVLDAVISTDWLIE